MLDAVVTLLWKHGTDINDVQNLIYYLKFITNLKNLVTSHSLKNVILVFSTICKIVRSHLKSTIHMMLTIII